MSHAYTPYLDLLRCLPAWDFEDRWVLDAGAGLGELAFYMKALTGDRRVQFRGVPKMVGFDINLDNVNKRGQGLYERYILWDAIVKPYPFLPRELGYVFCLETLEHIPEGKKASLEILGYLESLAPRTIISVPYGLHKTEKRPEAEFMHYSAWYPEDFTQRGYRVFTLDLIGLRGLPSQLYTLFRSVRGDPPEHILAIREAD